MKIAGAPISWGVCEVPGWGHQMAPERVLQEMCEIGLTATEFGPQGWLPVEPRARAAEVARYGLTPVGAFFLAVMHDPESDPIPAVERELEAFEVAGGSHLILAAHSGSDGYDARPVLDEAGWRTLFDNLDRIGEVCAARGVTGCLHPHWENRREAAHRFSPRPQTMHQLRVQYRAQLSRDGTRPESFAGSDRAEAVFRFLRVTTMSPGADGRARERRLDGRATVPLPWQSHAGVLFQST